MRERDSREFTELKSASISSNNLPEKPADGRNKMAAFNPYQVDEIVTQAEERSNCFGLIDNSIEAEELHGYEVTLSGRLALPELHPEMDGEKQ